MRSIVHGLLLHTNDDYRENFLKSQVKVDSAQDIIDKLNKIGGTKN